MSTLTFLGVMAFLYCLRVGQNKQEKIYPWILNEYNEERDFLLSLCYVILTNINTTKYNRLQKTPKQLSLCCDDDIFIITI